MASSSIDPKTLTRAEDIALAVSVATWGVGSIFGWSQHGHEVPLAVRLSMGAVHLTAAWLFLRREPARDAPLMKGMMAALPTLLLSGIAFMLGASHLNVAGMVVVACAALWTCASLLALGTSFAVLPSRRTLVVRGPYAWMRHPAYAGELVISGACLVAAARWESLLVGVLLVVGTWLRCRAEERVLAGDVSYADYMKRVPFRLLPHLW